jgi:hypothetical protein
MMRPQNRASQTPPQDAEAQPVHQFPEIEKLIESEDFDRINKSFTAAYEELEKLGKSKGGLGKSRDAKKAMRAIERVMDLLRELLKVKFQIQQGGGPGPVGK